MIKKVSIIVVMVLLVLVGYRHKNNTKTFEEKINIDYAPGLATSEASFFSDAGSWMGFNLPGKEFFTNALPGPYDFDSQKWMVDKGLVVDLLDENDAKEWKLLSQTYEPGSLVLRSHKHHVNMRQSLRFVSATQALLQVVTDKKGHYSFSFTTNYPQVFYQKEQQRIIIFTENDEQLLYTFSKPILFEKVGNQYNAITRDRSLSCWVTISHLHNTDAATVELVEREISHTLSNPVGVCVEGRTRWHTYMKGIQKQHSSFSDREAAMESMIKSKGSWKTSKGRLRGNKPVASWGFTKIYNFENAQKIAEPVALYKYVPHWTTTQGTQIVKHPQSSYVIDIIQNNPQQQRLPSRNMVSSDTETDEFR